MILLDAWICICQVQDSDEFRVPQARAHYIEFGDTNPQALDVVTDRIIHLKRKKTPGSTTKTANSNDIDALLEIPSACAVWKSVNDWQNTTTRWATIFWDVVPHAFTSYYDFATMRR